MSPESVPQLAQVNVARLRAPIDSPDMAGLRKGLDDVNWLAERSAGFVWRHRAEEGLLTYAQLPPEGEVVVTLSVWTSVEELRQYVYRSAHALFMQRRARWFFPIGGFTTAMWWIPEGSRPSITEGLDRLNHLRTHGPTPRAFSLRQPFDPAGERLRV